MYKVGTFTSLIPLSKPTPIACVASEIWKTAAYNINTADNDNTAALSLKVKDKNQIVKGATITKSISAKKRELKKK